MGIVWLILKILGITLLVILLIVLLLLAALLFCAFKYEVEAAGDKEGPQVDATVRVRWLFRIVSFRYIFKLTPDGSGNENGYILRVFGIPVKTSCGIEDNNVQSFLLGMLQCCLCNRNGTVTGSHCEARYALLLGIDLQLVNGCRTVDVAGNQQRLLALCLKLSGKLGRRSRFTCTLKTAHHDHGCFSGTKRDLGRFRPHQSDHFFIYDFDNHLARGQTGHYILAYGTFLYRADELLYNLKVYVRL